VLHIIGGTDVQCNSNYHYSFNNNISATLYNLYITNNIYEAIIRKVGRTRWSAFACVTRL